MKTKHKDKLWDLFEKKYKLLENQDAFAAKDEFQKQVFYTYFVLGVSAAQEGMLELVRNENKSVKIK